MEAMEIMDIGRDAIWLMIVISSPVLIVALVVGLIISLFQALTQIQEATLAFVPKMFAIFITLLVAMPFMFGKLKDFSENIADRIIHVQEQDEQDSGKP